MASLSSNTDGEITEFKSRLVHGLFTKPEQQLARVREWNERFDWGISNGVFSDFERSIPSWHEERLVAVVLVPYLADKKREDGTIMGGVERTFHELWTLASAEQDASYLWRDYNKADSGGLRLPKGINHPCGRSGQTRLRWEVIHLGCHRNKRAFFVRSLTFAPNAGILAAAALHPQWVKSMDGENVPYVFLQGYDVGVPELDWRMRSMPSLYFDRAAQEIGLSSRWSGEYGSDWAVPAFVLP